MSPRQRPLHLHEEIMLLALRDAEGTVEFGSMYNYALGGALVAELLLAERIRVEDSKKKLVAVVNERPLGEPLLDECLEKIISARRRAKLQTWVQRFANIGRLKHRVAAGLCERGILRADEKTILLIFRRKVYPEVDSRPERALIERLRKAIFTDQRDVDPRTVVLVALAHAAELLKIPFAKKELKRRKERITLLTRGEITGKATQDALQAMRAAAACAAIPVLAATCVSN